MNIEERVRSFASLGTILREAAGRTPAPGTSSFVGRVRSAMQRAGEKNPWFTESNLRMAIGAWGDLLTEANLTEWLRRYPWVEREMIPRRIGIVMAGNIPMVGFHDILCVLASGNIVVAKLSGHDDELIPCLTGILRDLEPGWEGMFSFPGDPLKGFDAIIATGSSNTSRYFEYYFGKYPHIIRGNRSSAAVLDGGESVPELEGLAADIFTYFGMGCRNVSKLLLPAGYDPGALIGSFAGWMALGDHPKYRNNYDYYRSIYLVNGEPFLDGAFFLMKEDPVLSSPVSVIHYEFYRDQADLDRMISSYSGRLQCLISRAGVVPRGIRPGLAQFPGLEDYADSVDTMQFLGEKI